LNRCIDLVPVEHQDNNAELHVESSGLSSLTYVGNPRLVTDLVLVNGRYVAIEHLDDGDDPLLEVD
jgi:hypothetical protein